MIEWNCNRLRSLIMLKLQSFLERKKLELGVELNEIQKQAVQMTEGPLLLLASPGSGKTTTLIMRTGYLIEEKGVRPERIKAVTFSKAAAKDMQERFSRFFPHLPLVDFSTIHSFAFRVVREYFYNNQREFALIEGAGPIHKKVLLRQIFATIHQENITEDQLEELVTYISYIKNKMIPEKKWATVTCDVPEAEEILKRYETFKKEYHILLVDYDDMLTLANEILETDMEILQKYQQMYDYVLTDESQDTSLVQHLIVEKLVEHHQNICIVADDDQSIYSWRGAEPQYLLDFKKVYPNAKILKMEQNYRSTKNIVDVANRFIKQNKNRYNKNMFTQNGKKTEIVRTALSDYMKQGKYLVEKVAKEENLGEVAILYRNHSSAIPLLNEFDLAGIPIYLKEGEQRFFNHWVVEDIKNFMRMAYNDRLPHLFEKIYNKFNGYISKKQMEYLKQVNNGQSVFENLISMSGLKDYQIKRIKKCQALFADMKNHPPKKVIELIREDLGYDKAIDGMCERLGFNKENLFGILNSLEEIAATEETMEQFVGRLKRLETLAKHAKNNHQGAVTLITLHSAKGLEFEKVYMIDLVDGVIPTSTEIDNYKKGETESMEEAVRLFYVGMTRAKTYLELISYQGKYEQKTKPSRFFNYVDSIIARLNGNIKVNQGNDTAVKRENVIKNPVELQVGKKIKHRVFGLGEIKRLENNIIEIQFSAEVKKMDIRVCIDYKLLERV